MLLYSEECSRVMVWFFYILAWQYLCVSICYLVPLLSPWQHFWADQPKRKKHKWNRDESPCHPSQGQPRSAASLTSNTWISAAKISIAVKLDPRCKSNQFLKMPPSLYSCLLHWCEWSWPQITDIITYLLCSIHHHLTSQSSVRDTSLFSTQQIVKPRHKEIKWFFPKSQIE